MLKNVNNLFWNNGSLTLFSPTVYCTEELRSSITHFNCSKDRQLIVPIICFNCFLISRQLYFAHERWKGDSKSLCVCVCQWAWEHHRWDSQLGLQFWGRRIQHDKSGITIMIIEIYQQRVSASHIRRTGVNTYTHLYFHNLSCIHSSLLGRYWSVLTQLQFSRWMTTLWSTSRRDR